VTLLAVLSSTLALVGQEVAAVLHDPARIVRHHHRRHRRRDVDPFATAVASWYDYAGATTGACGALYSNGVANKTMPCGLRLVICAARCASAVVDDRGPFVAGRDFDLSASLAQDVGFVGVGPIRWRLA
jgi:rare lipoprotein A (peptidoglycan hydrolase)